MAIDTQVLYLGRWVPREHFRAYVYSDKGKKLIESYEEYISAIASGEYFSESDLVPYSGEKVVQMRQKKRRKGDKGGNSL